VILEIQHSSQKARGLSGENPPRQYLPSLRLRLRLRLRVALILKDNTALLLSGINEARQGGTSIALAYGGTTREVKRVQERALNWKLSKTIARHSSTDETVVKRDDGDIDSMFIRLTSWPYITRIGLK
jgi:hypothetical protein